MHNKIVLITGANSGLGEETVRNMILRNATVIMACRNLKRVEKIKRNIENKLKF